jgi:hypothetical protein
VSASDCAKCGKSLARHPCGRDVELELLTLKNHVQRVDARIVELEYAVVLLKTALAGVVA